jgi:hypothetical protein
MEGPKVGADDTAMTVPIAEPMKYLCPMCRECGAYCATQST